jgi:hypothetical protein
MEYLKKKSGGCSSMNYADVSDNYMLMDNAIAKTGGAKRRKSKKSKKSRKGGNTMTERDAKELFSGGNPPNDMFGGSLRRHGGVGKEDDMKGGSYRRHGGNDGDMKGGSYLRRGGGKEDDMFGGSLRRRGGNEAPSASSAPTPTGFLGMGSAITDFTKNIGITSGGAERRREEREGGCGLRSCKKNGDKKKGGATGVELAPFISSLVILGLRAANDKALQSGITKKLGSLVSSSKKSKKSKSRKTKSVSN